MPHSVSSVGSSDHHSLQISQDQMAASSDNELDMAEDDRIQSPQMPSSPPRQPSELAAANLDDVFDDEDLDDDDEFSSSSNTTADAGTSYA